MNISLFGLTFHLYGLIVGLALATGVVLAEKQAQKHNFDECLFSRVLIALVVGGVLGARLWHVFTDWHLYQDRLWAIPQVWNGGLSIIGSIVGAFIGLVLLKQLLPPEDDSKHFIATVADFAVFGLPVAQAVGRLANFVNQELYGLPTSLPWGIPISPEHRVAQYAQFTHFHPLFAYEAAGMLVFAAVVWTLERRKIWQVGSGKFALLYIAWYGVFRGLLEFLRVEKSFFLDTPLGFNQMVLFGAGLIASGFLLKRVWKSRLTKLVVLVLCAGLSFASCQSTLPQDQSQGRIEMGQLADVLLRIEDRSRAQFEVVRQGNTEQLQLTFEVVNSRNSVVQGLSGRDEVGSDGMLFVFPDRKRHGFWMKDMKFSLDIIWIADGKVIEVTADVPYPIAGTLDKDLLHYAPKQPINMILEVPAGKAAAWGLQSGDEINLL